SVDRVFYGALWGECYPGTGARLLYGCVVDFIHLDVWRGVVSEAVPFLGGRYLAIFPIGNVADLAIIAGVAAIILFQRRFHRQAEALEAAGTPGAAAPVQTAAPSGAVAPPAPAGPAPGAGAAPSAGAVGFRPPPPPHTEPPFAPVFQRSGGGTPRRARYLSRPRGVPAAVPRSGSACRGPPAHPQLLHHRPHRPREEHPGRPPPRGHRHALQ